MSLIVLSHFQVKPLLAARDVGDSLASISPDLNLSSIDVAIGPAGAVFPNGERLTWVDAERIGSAENKCFHLRHGDIHEIAAFSEVTQWPRSLYPTERAPTMLVSGLTMHRIRGMDPHADTLIKIRATSPTGAVLDTATGLGYTAIEAAKTAEEVITVELDPASLEIARLNPWSQALFDNPKITQIIGDAFDVVEGMDNGRFSCVIHDPPTFSLAGDLYSGDFYREIFRVLRRRGRMFHYIGDLNSKSGQGVAHGAIRRLREAGFERIERRVEAFGVVAYK